MKITVIGTGYVGLVTGACLAEMGNHVVCLDRDAARVDALGQGHVPIHEPGLGDIMVRNVQAGRLVFTTDVASSVKHGLLQMIAVGTPAGDDGSADLQHVLAAARAIAEHMDDYKLVVTKSTVPVGTADQLRRTMDGVMAGRSRSCRYAVASNPEFLKEGSAVQDFMRPDRVVVGSRDPDAIARLRTLYAPFMRNRDRFVVMDERSAEFTKYAANAMLATRISFMNELALLAETLGADIENVRTGMGMDPRIGTHFLYAGAGYGGSCFPKDVSALLHAAAAQGQPLQILQGVQAVNNRQKGLVAEKVTRRFGPDLHGLRFAVWGMAFKPGTDDMREAPSLTVIRELLSRGAQVCAYDPAAMARARALLCPMHGARVHFAASANGALDGADALIILTEWKEFRSPDFDQLRVSLRTPVVFDGRNLFDPSEMKSLGFEYHAIGRVAP